MSVAEIFESMDYGPAPESASAIAAWLDERGRRFGHFIGGRWRDPAERAWFDSVNPANKQVLASIAHGGEADVDSAIAAARAAQPAWAKLGGHGRARHLYALARTVQRHARFLAVLETMDNGKPIRESRDIDIPLVARHFYHHAGWAQLLDAEFADSEPLGVAGQIIPWNFPLLMLAWKVAPALAAGNTAVLKPAEFTSLTALRFAELCAEAGLPPGVLNIVTGDGATGERIVRHAGIDKIAFTGSTEVGRQIREATAGTGKKLTLELGGKSPYIVFDDADLDSAVEGVVDAIWFNQGEVCCAGSRLLLQESIAGEMIGKLRARMEALRIGDPLDDDTLMGPLVNQQAIDDMLAARQKVQDEGGEILYGGELLGGDDYPGGLYVTPCIAAAENHYQIVQDETFAPILYIIEYGSADATPAEGTAEIDEAVEIHNAVPQGLSSSIFTDNVREAEYFISHRGSDCGIANVNIGTSGAEIGGAFGGEKETGGGRESGSDAWKAYMRRQTNTVNWGTELPLAQGVSFDVG